MLPKAMRACSPPSDNPPLELLEADDEEVEGLEEDDGEWPMVSG
jgi:hypothetical protein